MHKLDKGSLSEGKILAALLAAGYKVSVPWGQNTRYDLIADKDDSLYRIQCKTAWLDKDKTFLTFNTQSCNATIIPKSYRGQIEFFAVYSPDLDKVYLLSVDDVGTVNCALRIKPTQNNQKKGVHFASDYEFG